MKSNDRAWLVKGQEFHFGGPMLMGILNVTPDSFSDGGNFFSHDRAIAHGYRLIQEGAEIIDIGGESTRPGSSPITAETELSRILPIINALAAGSKALISVDTQKAVVAEAALANGAHIINDVSAGRNDTNMLKLISDTQAGYVMMHMQGTPATMQEDPRYTDIVEEIDQFFTERLKVALSTGLQSKQIVFDPGIGFGKTLKNNLSILKNMQHFHKHGRPLLLGASRKSFIGMLDNSEPDQRLGGSLAAALAAYQENVEIYRVHDVAETKQMLELFTAIQKHSD
ncbi:MAG: dihydropteroate synthase [Candidatus Marinimicrobia bacterium]|nr:dihydropteroate synthase [Candidatus Neomarinimicrobiota bacterium]